MGGRLNYAEDFKREPLCPGDDDGNEGGRMGAEMISGGGEGKKLVLALSIPGGGELMSAIIVRSHVMSMSMRGKEGKPSICETSI